MSGCSLKVPKKLYLIILFLFVLIAATACKNISKRFPRNDRKVAIKAGRATACGAYATAGGAMRNRTLPGGRRYDRGYKRGHALIDVYVSPDCYYCEALENFLETQGIAYERKVVDSRMFPELAKLGLEKPQVPVTKIGRDVVVGYLPDEIVSKLKKNCYAYFPDPYRF